MRGTRSPVLFVAVFTVVFGFLAVATPAFAGGKYTVLYRFNGKDGTGPTASVFDAAGNLYGTTQSGGPGCGYFGCGVVFQLSPGANGKWTEKVLHNFANDGNDGWGPDSGVIFDTAGNLYGTTEYGGGNPDCTCGAVFRLVPGANGAWAEIVLYSFTGGNDGANPYGGLIFDASGKLYGTTTNGGNGGCIIGCGTVFRTHARCGRHLD